MNERERRNYGQLYYPKAAIHEVVERGHQDEPVRSHSSIASVFAFLFDMITGKGGSNRFTYKKRGRR